MCRTIAFLVALFVLSLNMKAQITIDQYIEQFKDLAVGEMDRSGIPASITLAQGILESRYGNSTLAQKANNHFGIKCHSTWEGKSYYIKDDDRNKHGKLIESCFRSYSSAFESYYDHSDFLTKKGRYSFLFNYDKTDYISWAKGLKQAGYATNNQYANLLIKVIEDNQLNQYDYMTNEVLVYNASKSTNGKAPIAEALNSRKDVLESVNETPVDEEAVTFKSEFPAGHRSGIFRINQIKTVSAKIGDTPEYLAKKYAVSLRRLLEYNDLKKGDKLLPNQYVFLQPKRIKYRERKTYHKTQKGQNMYIISQLYGLRLDELTARNLLEANEEPVPGSRIYLNKPPQTKPVVYVPTAPPQKRPSIRPALSDTSKEAIAYSKHKAKQEDPKRNPFLGLIDKIRGKVEPQKAATTSKSIPKSKSFNPPATNSSPKSYTAVTTKTADPSVIKKDKMLAPDALSTSKVAPVPPPTFENATLASNSSSKNSNTNNQPIAPKKQSKHVVQKGDTLYNIARQYGISVSELRTKNAIGSNSISVGQELVVE